MIDKNFYYLDIRGHRAIYYTLKDDEYAMIADNFRGLKFKHSNIGTHYNGKEYTSTICLTYDNLCIKSYYTGPRKLIIDFILDGEVVGFGYFKPHGRDPVNSIKITGGDKFFERLKAVGRKNKLKKLYV